MHTIIAGDARTIAEADLPWKALARKAVLISGANGYVPAYFVHGIMSRNDLYGENIRVTALCRNGQKAKERFADYVGRDDFSLLIQDVCAPIDKDVRADYFIHAASPSGYYQRHEFPAATFSANVTGAANMLEQAAYCKAEGFLLVSSVDAYGAVPGEKRLVETDAGVLDSLNIRNAYACGKRAAETLSVCYHGQYGVPVTIARPFQIVGPGIALDDGRLHADFAGQMLSSDKIALKGDGSAKRTFMYVADAITGMLTVLLKVGGAEAYNICDEAGEATVLELAALMASLADGREIQVVFQQDKRDLPEVKQALSSVTGSAGKLRSIGWRPMISLEQGLKRMMRYYGL